MTVYGNSRVTICQRCGAGMIGRTQRFCWRCTDWLTHQKPFPAEWAASHCDPIPDAIRHESYGILGNAIGWVVVTAVGIVVDVGRVVDRWRKL